MSSIIEKTVAFVQQRLEGAESGHDWFHTERVWKMACYIHRFEGGNKRIIELAALLHDIADPKFHDGDEQLALKLSEDFLRSQDIAEEEIQQILMIIKLMSFKNREEMPSDIPVELQIVQDADRIDALGAIGIARTFNFGGYKNNKMYDPAVTPALNMDKEQYKKSEGTTINHFYEKLLLLKDMMNTETAKKIAAERHVFMLRFLDRFYFEWHEGSQ